MREVPIYPSTHRYPAVLTKPPRNRSVVDSMNVIYGCGGHTGSFPKRPRPADTTSMDDTPRSPDVSVLQWKALRAGAPVTGHTDRLVREAWRRYYVARLAEAQFGPDSLEASIAHLQAMTSYRELRGTLRELDPYYRTRSSSANAETPVPRHLKLVRDDNPEPEHQPEPQP
jgi:hypothetical protein